MTNEEILKIIKETVEKHPLTYSMILFSKKNSEIRDYIYLNTKKLDVYEKLEKRTRIYCVLNGIEDFPKCKICGNKIIRNIKSTEHGGEFAKYCSPRCENKDPDVIDKLNKTNLNIYGVKWSFQSENNKSKSKKTMLDKYGVEYAQQNNEIKQKSYDTMEKKYGNKFPSKVRLIKLKMNNSSKDNMYEKFLSSDKIQPLFSREDYRKYGNSIPYMWKCMKCGNSFESFVDKSWFKQGQNRTYARCEYCYPRDAFTSSGEQELISFIKSIYGGKTSVGTRCLGDMKYKLEIDILLDDLNIGFEYDGLYYHSEKCGKPNDYHIAKTKMADEIGITLIHVFENEWMNKRDIVKSRIKNLIGIFENIVYARCCNVVEINRSKATEFVEKAHIQGWCSSSVNLGLYYGDKLVSVMTFGKSRFNRKYEWELLRFCNELGYHVIGGAGKLLKYFERNYNPKSLISYADRRWSKGNLYLKLGFSHISNTRPNYWYFKNLNLLSRVQFQKHKLKTILKHFDEKLTEVENMFKNGYNRIFDCGNMVFTKEY